MAYLDSHGLGTLWNKIKAHFGKSLEVDKSATAVDIKLKNAASTPDVLSTITLPAAGTNNQAGVMTSAQASKLDGIAAGAEVNVQADWNQTTTTADDFIKNKPNLATVATSGSYTDLSNKPTIDSSISSTSTNAVQNKVIKTALDGKVDVVSGKGLSTNDYTTAEKNKLAGIEAGAEVNVQPNWDEADSTSDAYIRNKPVIPDGAVIYHNLGQNTDGAIDQKVVTNELNAKEVSSNKVTSWSATTTDAHYPSEKLVKTELDGKVPTTRKVNGKALSSDVTIESGDIHMTSRDASVTVNSAITAIEDKYVGLVENDVHDEYIALQSKKLDDKYNVSLTNHTHSINGNELGDTNKTSSDLGLQGEHTELTVKTTCGFDELVTMSSIDSIEGDVQKAIKNAPNITFNIKARESSAGAYENFGTMSGDVEVSTLTGETSFYCKGVLQTGIDTDFTYITFAEILLKVSSSGALVSDSSYINIASTQTILVDEELSSSSTMPVQNVVITEALGGKVDKVTGKGLSTNDYTTTEKNKLAGIAENANNYVHPTTSGNKHIPSGGSSGKILGWSADGTAAWIDAPDTGVTKITAGSNVTISPTGGTGNVTINATDTTYVFNTAYNASTNKAATMSDINSAVAGNAKYRGTLASEAALTGLTNYKQGNYWVVSSSWTSTAMGITLDAGNMLFANKDASTFAKANFDVIQADIEAIPDSEINALS